ncbi:hypothetical protein DFH07DRAFT_997684 [Mycena maculata]|uniref:Uncharacterized protein n=1 Tax=Mycena maculata TaxID=230809 RepID=A0AAD7NRB0_9AGAR|nr:hypothetical protein DFH07DRAFT_997684 [Mycena maculata]
MAGDGIFSWRTLPLRLENISPPRMDSKLVNNPSTPLVALRLFPSMIKTAQEYSTQPRLVIVSGEVRYLHEFEKAVVESLEIVKTFTGAEYCTRGKVMDDRYTLTKHTTGDSHFSGFNLRHEYNGLMAIVGHLMEFALAFTSEVGSRQPVWTLAKQDEPEKLCGEYISAFQVQEVGYFALSPQGVQAQGGHPEEGRPKG